MKSKYCMCRKTICEETAEYWDKLPSGAYTVELWTCGTEECEEAMRKHKEGRWKG